MRTIVLALAVGAVLSAGAVALASGGQPPVDGYPPPGVTALGIASAPVDAENSDSEATIRRAVASALKRAEPRAFERAARKARELAATAGMRLGAVWSVSQDANIPYGGPLLGTFGYDRYCGTVRRAVGYRIDSRGRRVRRYVRRHACRAPDEATASLSVTFAQG